MHSGARDSDPNFPVINLEYMLTLPEIQRFQSRAQQNKDVRYLRKTVLPFYLAYTEEDPNCMGLYNRSRTILEWFEKYGSAPAQLIATDALEELAKHFAIIRKNEWAAILISFEMRSRERLSVEEFNNLLDRLGDNQYEKDDYKKLLGHFSERGETQALKERARRCLCKYESFFFEKQLLAEKKALEKQKKVAEEELKKKDEAEAKAESAKKKAEAEAVEAKARAEKEALKRLLDKQKAEARELQKKEKAEEEKRNKPAEEKAKEKAEKQRLEALAKKAEEKAEQDKIAQAKKLRKEKEEQERLAEEAAKKEEADDEENALKKVKFQKKADEKAKKKELTAQRKLHNKLTKKEKEARHEMAEEAKSELSIAMKMAKAALLDPQATEFKSQFAQPEPLYHTIKIDKIPDDLLNFAADLKGLSGQEVFLGGSTAANLALNLKPPVNPPIDWDIRLFGCDQNALYAQILKKWKDKIVVEESENVTRPPHPVIRLKLKRAGQPVDISIWKKSETETLDEAMLRNIKSHGELTPSSAYMNLTDGSCEVRGSKKCIESLINKNFNVDRDDPDSVFIEDCRRLFRYTKKKSVYTNFTDHQDVIDILKKHPPRDCFAEILKPELKHNKRPAQMSTLLEELFSHPKKAMIDIINSWYSHKLPEGCKDPDMFEAFTGLSYKRIEKYLPALEPYKNSPSYTKKLVFFVFVLANQCVQLIENNPTIDIQKEKEKLKQSYFYEIAKRIKPQDRVYLEQTIDTILDNRITNRDDSRFIARLYCVPPAHVPPERETNTQYTVATIPRHIGASSFFGTNRSASSARDFTMRQNCFLQMLPSSAVKLLNEGLGFLSKTVPMVSRLSHKKDVLRIQNREKKTPKATV